MNIRITLAAPFISALMLLFISLPSLGQNLTVNGVSPYGVLDLTTSFNGSIASITENWIAGQGGGHNYVLSVRSANGGLMHATQTTSKISYSLRYLGSNGLTVTMTTTNQTIGTRSVNSSTAAGSATADATIAYTGVPATSLYQGQYSDTLTFTYVKTGPGGTVTVTRTLVLTAQLVNSTLSFSLTPTAAASSLPLLVSQSNLNVATAYEASNSNTGYLVKARSLNGSFLKNTAAGATPTALQTINYTITYGGVGMTLTTPNIDTIIKTVNTGLYSGVSNAVNLTYTAPAPGTKQAGTYTDVLTFTIEAR